MNRRRGPVLLLLDVLAVLVFAGVGRANHDEAGTLGGLLSTAWPFLLGTGVGWVVTRAWRRPADIRVVGVRVWLCTVVVGMLLRALTGSGTAPSFVVVATLVLGAVLVGWRLVLSASRFGKASR
jgi:hypothetical protein